MLRRTHHEARPARDCATQAATALRWFAHAPCANHGGMMPFDDNRRAEDAALMAAYAAGDRAAAREIVAAYGPRCHRLALRQLGPGQEAEDVAQEAMLRLWRIAPEWQAGTAQISTWLYRVVSNLCTDRLRQRPRVPVAWPEGFDPADPASGAAETGMQDAARAAALRAALAALPARQRIAIALRDLDERSNPEIAEVLEISVEAVESLLSRGRRALKAALFDAAGELGYKDG